MNPSRSNSWRRTLAQQLPVPALAGLRRVRDVVNSWRQRTVITAARGCLEPRGERACALLVVGHRFDQRKPDAMMTCRMGYANAFEARGIPYLICDWRELPGLVERLPHAFAVVFGADVPEMNRAARRALTRIPNAVWVNPWFDDEDSFFAAQGLLPGTWVWPAAHRDAIVNLRPRFVFTATVGSGLTFFSGWSRAGLTVKSLPLACDVSLYRTTDGEVPEFAGVRLAFVGGYWDSKGQALDRYLRPFEDDLVIYGYNRWPYRGYRGKLPRLLEPALYHQACVCPVVNEPTVALLKGQINERVFKIFGAGGVAVVDAVPAYRELFTAEELPIPGNAEEFAAQIRALWRDPELRRQRASQGRAAVLARHTYDHRVEVLLDGLGLEAPACGTPSVRRVVSSPTHS